VAGGGQPAAAGGAGGGRGGAAGAGRGELPGARPQAVGAGTTCQGLLVGGAVGQGQGERHYTWPRPLSLANGRCVAQALPLKALKLALRSEDLELLSENDAYALASGWADSRPKGQRTEAFTELVRCLRFHHMSPSFLTTMVLWSKRWADCPFLAQASSSALAYQSLTTSFSKVPHRHAARHPYTSAKPSRAPDQHVPYSFEVEVPLADCLPLGVNEKLGVRVGVAEGYVVQLIVKREVRGGRAATVSVLVSLKCVNVRAMGEGESDTVALSGPMAEVRIAAADRRCRFTQLFQVGRSYGVVSFFGKPWDEVVREGSESFPEGRMTVKLNVQFISDKHMKPQVPVMG
jgi:hypothetical protein